MQLDLPPVAYIYTLSLLLNSFVCFGLFVLFERDFVPLLFSFLLFLSHIIVDLIFYFLFFIIIYYFLFLEVLMRRKEALSP